MAVFYYAGHALQVDRQNLLLPVDTSTSTAKEIVADAVRLNDLIDIVKDDPVGVKLFILDACRDNPLVKEKGLEEGLAYTEAGSGQVLIAFATSAGEAAYDGTGINSPYSSALANALQTPDLDIYDTFRTVRGDVRQATAGFQIPWITGSIETKFVFRQADAGAAVASPAQPAEAGSGLTIDEVLWSFIKDSPNPEDFGRFAEVFPSSRFAREAAEKSQVQTAALSQRGVFISGPLKSTTIATDVLVVGESSAARQEFIFQQAGERAVSESFRVWPSELPDTQRGMKALVTNCDLYAADPNDPQRAVPGVSNGLVNVRDALRACAFDLAVDVSNPRLLFQFGRVLEIARRYDWAEYYYELAGKQQYSAALVNLGYMARVGMGREVDYKRAFDYYMQAAAMGNLRARTNIGTAYMRGQGVPELPEEGVLWYRLAASSGWSNAINALGDAYRRGEGVKADPVEAGALYTAASDAGQIDAMTSLGRAYVSGSGVEKDVSRGYGLLLKATELGNQYAPRYAGQLLLKGEGVDRDARRALAMFETSARRGFEDAYLDLARGYRDGAFGKADLPQAYFNATLADRFKVDKAGELKEQIGKQLKPDVRQKVEADVDLFVEQNGK